MNRVLIFLFVLFATVTAYAQDGVWRIESTQTSSQVVKTAASLLTANGYVVTTVLPDVGSISARAAVIDGHLLRTRTIDICTDGHTITIRAYETWLAGGGSLARALEREDIAAIIDGLTMRVGEKAGG